MMVHPASHRVSRALWYSGTGLGHSSISSTGVSPSMLGLSRPFDYQLLVPYNRPTTPTGTCTLGLASSPFARHYWGNLG